MTRPKKTSGESRHGKHAPGMFRVSLYLSAEEKAIAIFTAECLGCTLSDIIRSGIVAEATRAGVLVNGRVPDKFRPRIDVYCKILEAETESRTRPAE